MSKHNVTGKPRPREWAGKEIFEMHPIILDGSPTDPADKRVLTREEHIAAVRYWNGVIRGLRSQALTAP